jgi:hypothetical protein
MTLCQRSGAVFLHSKNLTSLIDESSEVKKLPLHQHQRAEPLAWDRLVAGVARLVVVQIQGLWTIMVE